VPEPTGSGPGPGRALRAAPEDRDAQAIADRLADDFKGNGSVDKAEAAATLRRYFAAYESVHLVVYDVAVTRRTDTEADLGFRAEFTGAARRIGGLDGFLPPSAIERFDLRPHAPWPDWKVAAADWRPIEPDCPSLVGRHELHGGRVHAVTETRRLRPSSKT
jgi:hypothetical protein